MPFKCPKCASKETFTVYDVVEMHRTVDVDSDGNVVETSGGDLTWELSSKIKCVECDHKGTVKKFELDIDGKEQ